MSENDDSEALPTFGRDELATEGGFFDVMFRLHDIKRECALPAVVEEYDRESHLATVKPLVKKFKETASGRVFWDRDSYKEIPVVTKFHGGFIVDAPIKEGDQGILIAIDRPWDEIFDTIQEDGKDWDGEAGKPDNESLASFEEGVFIPYSYGKVYVDKANENDLIIARVDEDGKVDGRIALGDRYVSIDVPTIITNGERSATIDANDLDKTDAKFREVTVVTGFKKKLGKIVKLFAKKFRVLSDEHEDAPDVEFEVGGGGGAALTLQYGGNTPVVYDGEEAKSFTVPAPETPGDGLLTLKVDGTVVETFSANQSEDAEFDVLTGLAISGNAPSELTDDQIVVQQRYDYTTHQLQARVRGINYNDAGTRIVSVTPASGWLMIEGGQCIVHT